MKKQITIFAIALASTFSCYAQKTFDLNSHINVVTALEKVQTSANDVRLNTQSCPDTIKARMMQLYSDTRNASNSVIAKYEIMLKNPRKAKKNRVDITPDLGTLEVANNKMVEYYTASFSICSQKPKSVITAEIVDLIFGTAEKLYDFLNKIKKEKREELVKDLSKRKIDKNYSEK